MRLPVVEEPLTEGSCINWASISFSGFSNFSRFLAWLDNGQVFRIPASAPEEINFVNCFKESLGSCFPRYALLDSADSSGLSFPSFPEDPMRTLRGLECSTTVLEAPAFFLRGNTEFSCGRKSRPGKERKRHMLKMSPNPKHWV